MLIGNSNRGYINASLRSTQVTVEGSGKGLITGDHEAVIYRCEATVNYDVTGARMESCISRGLNSTQGEIRFTACKGTITQENTPERMLYRGCDISFITTIGITSGVNAERKLRLSDGIYKFNFNGNGITFTEGAAKTINFAFDNCYLIKDSPNTGDIFEFLVVVTVGTKLTVNNVIGVNTGGGVVFNNSGAATINRAMYNNSYINILNSGSFTDVITSGGVFIQDPDVTEI